MRVSTAQFGQADLSKTEAHTDAPMRQLLHQAQSLVMFDLLRVFFASFLHVFYAQNIIVVEILLICFLNLGLETFGFPAV